MTHDAPTHWPRIFLLWGCGVVAAMQFAKMAIAFDLLQAHYGITQTQMGWALSIVGLVAVLLGATVGLFAPAIGYRRLLLLGLSLGAVLSTLQSLLPPFPWLMTSRVVEGVSHLAIVVAAPTLIANHCASAQRPVAMGLWSTFVGVAFAASAAFGAWWLSRFGVGSYLRLHAGAMALLAMAVVAALPRDQDADQASRWPDATTLVTQHLDIYRHFATAVPGFCFFFYTVVGVALLTFVPQLGGSQRTLLAVILPLTVMVGTFSAGWLTRHRLSPLQLARAAFAGVALSAMVLWATEGNGTAYLAAAILLLYAAGLAGGAGFALVPFLNAQSAPQARANGAIAQLGNLGSSTGPPLFAASISVAGLPGLVLPLVAFALLGAAVASWAHRRHVLLKSLSA